MITNSHQTGTLQVSRQVRLITLGRIAGWLIVCLAVASLLAGLIWSHNLAQYPGATRQEDQFQLGFWSLNQQTAYQTPDDLPRVLSWHAKHFGLVHEMPQGDHCVMMTQADTHFFLRQSLTITLCSEPTRTLIFIHRRLTLR